MKTILVMTEQINGVLKNASREILTNAVEMARDNRMHVRALAFGPEVSTELLQEIASCGVGDVYTCESSFLERPHVEVLLPVLIKAVEDCDPQLVFAANTAIGRDVLPPAAHHFQSQMVSDAVHISWKRESWEFTKIVYSSRVQEFNSFFKNRQRVFATIRPNTLGVLEQKNATLAVQSLDHEVKEPVHYLIRELKKRNQARKHLYEADVIVCGGRGVRKEEDIRMLEELADVLGASMGFSRALIESGFRPRSLQIGLSGKTVSPRLIITCGISGAIQFVGGMANSQHIISIDKNPRATIFKTAHYGIVGDLYQVVPALTEAFRKTLHT